MKKIISIFLSFIIISASSLYSVGATTAQQKDEFWENADFLAEKGIIKVSDKREGYRLHDNVTRGEMAKIVFGLFNTFNSDNIYFRCDESFFKDVTKDGGFCDYITPLVEKNVFKKADNFRIKDKLTRAEMVLILARALYIQPKLDYQTSFKDIDKNADYYGYLNAFVEKWWIKDSASFRPSANITRGEIFTVIARTLSGKGD
ncbi:MAG: S-layer homology domain-containing protein [Candidatus Gracilibacteria bacterium]|nr:S-layer homology domain-containing protein [Candidatus Gracilibacteria bacterium]MDD3119989.1 S-layer homology domain-containing protein [Candidatus Gracilibacteria bacterium]MDD4530344.1 S-layer homology domain-containing protein [Candidatus Gracilibacteria bacterium]